MVTWSAKGVQSMLAQGLEVFLIHWHGDVLYQVRQVPPRVAGCSARCTYSYVGRFTQPPFRSSLTVPCRTVFRDGARMRSDRRPGRMYDIHGLGVSYEISGKNSSRYSMHGILSVIHLNERVEATVQTLMSQSRFTHVESDRYALLGPQITLRHAK